eukprot:TCONS_00021383-protein
MMSSLLKVVPVSAAVLGTGGFFYKTFSSTLKADESIHEEVQNLLERKSRAAVIGGGIGGASTCYFLRKLLGDSIDIDVYEKDDRLGGRLNTLDVNGQTVECGGTYILKGHRYMVQFAEDTDSETNDVLNDAKMRVWNGESLINLPSSMWWVDLVKTTWRYGPLNLWRLDNTIDFVDKSFKRIYNLQEEGVSFETVPEMFSAMDETQQLFEFTQKSFQQVMREKNIHDSVTNELINPIIRWNLGQDADDVNGLVGFLIAGGGKDGPVWNFKDGNNQVCQKLFQSSKAEVRYHSHVKSIDKLVTNQSSEGSGNQRVQYRLLGENIDAGRSYDVVIVATPLEIPSCYVNCGSCQAWPSQSDLGQYQKRLTNFVESELNTESYNVTPESQDAPDVILTTKADKDNYDTVIRLYQTNGQKTLPAVHKVFSRESLTEEQIKFIFGDQVKDYKVVSWLACPRYTAEEKFISFRLDDGVFNVNAIERMKVGLEFSAIGARNVALLASKYLKESCSKF